MFFILLYKGYIQWVVLKEGVYDTVSVSTHGINYEIFKLLSTIYSCVHILATNAQHSWNDKATQNIERVFLDLNYRNIWSAVKFNMVATRNFTKLETSSQMTNQWTLLHRKHHRAYVVARKDWILLFFRVREKEESCFLLSRRISCKGTNTKNIKLMFTTKSVGSSHKLLSVM